MAIVQRSTSTFSSSRASSSGSRSAPAAARAAAVDGSGRPGAVSAAIWASATSTPSRFIPSRSRPGSSVTLESFGGAAAGRSASSTRSVVCAWW
ncbi:hypothetical protein [Micromonospora chersina]|uniref:hypothetical protein n=1 Tax=Micromonospora chersina TaxID=47854 RepID=UPI003D9258CD